MSTLDLYREMYAQKVLRRRNGIKRMWREIAFAAEIAKHGIWLVDRWENGMPARMVWWYREEGR